MTRCFARAADDPRQGAAAPPDGAVLAHTVDCTAPVLGCFDAETLSGALGVGNAVHAVLADGPEAAGFSALAFKLAGFVNLDPAGGDAQKS